MLQREVVRFSVPLRVPWWLVTQALLGACATPAKLDTAAVAPVPVAPRVAPAPSRPAPEAIACEGDEGPSPPCDAPCAPRVLWTRSYGEKGGFSPTLLAMETDPKGDLVIAGATGRGPTYVGGKPLYDAWPRSLGEAFIAKYDREGAHLWSRQLFDASAAERRQGGRSSAWALALGGQGEVHAFVSRVLVAQSGTHLVTLSEGGSLLHETWVRQGLPVLVRLAERGGAPSALGVRDLGGESLELAEHHIEPSGALYYERLGSVPRPPGVLSMVQAHFHPRGVLFTAMRTLDAHSPPASTPVCPVQAAERDAKGRVVRDPSGVQPVECRVNEAELLAVLVGSSGKVEWLRSFSVPGYDASSDAVTVDASGSIVWVGPFVGTARFGDHAICATGLPDGYIDDFLGGADSRCECLKDYADTFVLKLDAAGDPRWVQRIGASMEDRPAAVLSDARGNIVLAVRSTELVDFTVPASGPQQTTWSVVAFSSDGKALWKHPLAGTAAPILASGVDGTVYVAEAVSSPAGVRLTALE